MKAVFRTLALSAGCLFISNFAEAHVGVAGPATAGSTYEATFGVGHGCEGFDTYSVRIKIPEGVTSVRVVENGSFATVTTEKDDAGDVTYVTFTKADSAVRAGDDAYYKLVVRMKLPNTPFTTLYFPTNQVCKSQDLATESSTDWTAESGGEDHSDAGEPSAEPAPALYLLPARQPGWNKYTTAAGVEIKDLATVFKDAKIVWAGDAAYSVNPATAALIAAEPDTEVLEEIPAGTEFWVKY